MRHLYAGPVPTRRPYQLPQLSKGALPACIAKWWQRRTPLLLLRVKGYCARVDPQWMLPSQYR